MSRQDHSVAKTLLAAALVLAPCLAGTAVRAADFTLKYGVVTQGDMQHLYGLKLKEVIEKATNGRVEVKVFPGGQLGTPQAHIEGVRLGTIEGYSNPADFFAGVDSRFGTFSIPYLFKDRDHANRTLADPELRSYILTMAEEKGLIGVNVAAQAEAHYFAKNPIRRLADFNGKKPYVVTGTLFLIAIGINIANVIGRYVFAQPIFWAEEVLVFIIVWSIFLAAATIVYRGEHLNMDLFYAVMKRPLKRAVNTLVVALFIACAAIVVVQSYKVVSLYLVGGGVSVAAGVPMIVPHAAILVGFSLMILALLVRLRAYVTGDFK
jgi:TRAP-type transport system small permease protein